MVLAGGVGRALATAGLVVAAAAAVAFLGPRVGLGLMVVVAALYLAWMTHPAWTLSAALMLSVFAGNWPELGIAGRLAPDRLLFVAGIAAVLIRAPAVRDRPPLYFGAVHWAMVLTVLWFTGSALAAETISNDGTQFEILERLGIVPFLLFLVAPVAFATEHHRRILLGAMVALGAYLGFTALMETLEFRQLVLPDYINDNSVGTHVDRARGPFVQAVTNGSGLFLGVVASAIALRVWSGRKWVLVAAGVLTLCFAGLLFTETRSVWLGAAVAIVITLLSTKELRRVSIPALAGGAVVVAISLAVVPGLYGAVDERRDDDKTVWDRKNLTTAALNMVEAHPLAGIGYDRFTAESANYFRQSLDYPLTGTDLIIHNLFLTYAAEAGLVGIGLWFVALCLGMLAALWPPARGEPQLWQLAVLAYFLFSLVMYNFVFPQLFPITALWLLAGVAVGANSARRAAE